MVRNGEVIWRAGDGTQPGVAVRRKPFLASVHDAQHGKRYRGGQCIALTATEITVKCQTEATLTQQATVARDLKPTIRLGDPVVVELAASGYTIAALHGGAFAGPGPAGDQEQSVASEYWPSRITEEFWKL